MVPVNIIPIWRQSLSAHSDVPNEEESPHQSLICPLKSSHRVHIPCLIKRFASLPTFIEDSLES